MRALTTSCTGRRGGFTLLEILISTTLAGVILGAIGMTVLTGKDNFRQGVSSALLEGQAKRALGRIVTELQAAGGTNLNPDPTPPLGSATLEFRACTGYSGSAQQWGPLTRIERIADPRDPADGVDNDSDGLIDEGRVVLVRDVGGIDEQQITLVGGVPRFLEGETANVADDNGNGVVDEAGLSFVIDAQRTLTIRLSLAGIDPRGQTMVRTIATAVHVRN